jgi:hypothetical protein
VSDLTPGNGLLSIVLVCVAVDLVVWFLYVHASDDAAFVRATKMLRHPLISTFIAGIGHVLPILLLITGMLGILAKSGFQDIIVSLAGLFILAGGVIEKSSVVMGANYARGIVMGKPKDLLPGIDQAERDRHPYDRCDRMASDFISKK